MKLSTETLNVLKSFSAINSGMEFKQSNKLKTISPSRAVLAEVTVKDTFTDSFCVEDLNEFLSVHSLFDGKAELIFDEHHINFKSGKSKIKYRKTDKTSIVTPPEKINFPTDKDVEFVLKAEDYDWILKTSRVLSSKHIAVQSDGEKVEIVTYDADLDTAHENSIELDVKGTGKEYKIVYSVDNFKLIPGEYTVSINFKGVTHFKNNKEDIQYWIAQEAKYSKVK
jgi:hypothetical protein